MAAIKKPWTPGSTLSPVNLGETTGYTLTARMTHEQLISLYGVLKSAGNTEYGSLIENLVPEVSEIKKQETAKVEADKATISDALQACERCELLRPMIPNDQKRVEVHYKNNH